MSGAPLGPLLKDSTHFFQSDSAKRARTRDALKVLFTAWWKCRIGAEHPTRSFGVVESKTFKAVWSANKNYWEQLVE